MKTQKATTTSGGALGATANRSLASSGGGTAAALGAVGKGSLPFTGFPLWTVFLIGLALLCIGLMTRSYAGRDS